MASRIAHVLLNDWPYLLGRVALKLFGIDSVRLESMADDPARPFPAWPRLVDRVDGRTVLSVFAQTLVGWSLVLVVAVSAVLLVGR